MQQTLSAPIASTATAPEPGIYRDLPAAEYHAWDCASNSRLSKLARTPAHLRAYLDNPPAPTPALIVGSALHMLVLEPELFPSHYCLAEPCSAKTAKGEPCSNSGKVRRAGAWLCGTHDKEKGAPGDSIQVLTAEQWEQVHAMATAIRLHPAASQLLGLAEDRELSIVWDDEESGVRCKARLDMVCPAMEAIVDLKTTGDASRREFERSIANFGYHRQAAHYLNGAAAAGIPATSFLVIAVEKTAPYAVQVFNLTDVAAQGRIEIAAHLATYRDCIERDVWPAYSDLIQEISLPAWALTTPSFDTPSDETF